MANPWTNSKMYIGDSSGEHLTHYETDTDNIVDFERAVNNLINNALSGTTELENLHVTGTTQLDGAVTVNNVINLADGGQINQDDDRIQLKTSSGSYLQLEKSGGYSLVSRGRDAETILNVANDGTLFYTDNAYLAKDLTVEKNLTVNGTIQSPIKLPHATITSNNTSTSIDTTSGSKITISNSTGGITMTTKSGNVFAITNAGKATIDGSELLTKNEMLTLEHPVGSVYFTLTDTNPSTILGIGTWEKIGAGLQLAIVGKAADKNSVNNTTAAGANAGEWKHSITANELTEHTHTMTCGNDDDGNGNSGHTHAKGTFRIQGKFSGVGNVGTSEEATLTGAFYRVNTAKNPSQGVTLSNDGYRDDYFGFDTDKNDSWTGECKNGGKHKHEITAKNAGKGNAMTIINPTFGIYMWKRTA